MNRMLRTALAASALATLAACSSLIGGPKQTPTIYAPDPPRAADPGWPAVQWQLGTTRPSAPRMLDSARIVVSPVPGELQVYKGALWASSAPDMVEAAVLHTLEDSGRLPAVARQGTGIAADYRLVMDIRHFEADYRGGDAPEAVVEVHAQLVHLRDQAVAGSRSFRQARPVAGTAVPLVADAFGQALGAIGHDIAGWVLASGEAHQQAAHPR